MFNVTTYDFAKKDFNNWKLKYDYHAVYILENGKDAYIGEASDIIKRAKRHSRRWRERKYNFNNMHVITGEYAEATPAHHYERLLIDLMKIDNKFNILNKKRGYNFLIYKRKNRFELYFDELWFKLEEKGLVNIKDFKSFINSEMYKYSPYNKLNREQIKALTSVCHVLDSGETLPYNKKYKERPILINGDAGTGKTLVAITLFNYLKNNARYQNMSIAFVVPNSPTRDMVEYIFSKTDGLSKKDVVSPIELTKNKYDIIICDEAHKLRWKRNLRLYAKHFKQANERLELDNNHDELDWLLMQSKYQILFYDKKQITSPTEISGEEFEKRLNERYRGIRPVRLKKQMRVQAGNCYVKYIRDILYQKTAKKKDINNYILKIIPNFFDMQKIINEKEEQFGLSRVASGYSFKWNNDETENAYDIFIDGVKTKWNSRTKGWLREKKYKDEVGSIYTLSGLDLNYIGVVIGPELYFDKKDNKIKVNRDKFFDNTVKRNTSDEELLKFILNTYSVLLTRAIHGTYIYVYDQALREYLGKFIDL